MTEETEDGSMPTHELMAWLDDKERDRFVKLQETFETDGWKLIEQFAQANVIQHGISGANAQTWEKCNEHRGARDAWDRVSNLANEFMTAFEVAAQNAREAHATEAEEA